MHQVEKAGLLHIFLKQKYEKLYLLLKVPRACCSLSSTCRVHVEVVMHGSSCFVGYMHNCFFLLFVAVYFF